MASNNNCEPHTPPKKIKQREFDTIKRMKFFDAFDHKKKDDSLRQICKRPDINIGPSTGRKWLKQREEYGSLALRRTRKLSSNLGRPFSVSASVLNDLIRDNNPLNTKPYETQVQQLDLPVTAHTLQQNFRKRKGARRFKKLKSRAISKENKVKRVKYGQEHRGKTITSFWQYVWFTDELYLNSQELAEDAEYSLR